MLKVSLKYVLWPRLASAGERDTSSHFFRWKITWEELGGTQWEQQYEGAARHLHWSRLF